MDISKVDNIKLARENTSSEWNDVSSLKRKKNKPNMNNNK